MKAFQRFRERHVGEHGTPPQALTEEDAQRHLAHVNQMLIGVSTCLRLTHAVLDAAANGEPVSQDDARAKRSLIEEAITNVNELREKVTAQLKRGRNG